MPARTRIREGTPISIAYRTLGTNYTDLVTPWRERCDDVTGNYGGDNVFSLEYSGFSGGVCNYDKLTTPTSMVHCVAPILENQRGTIALPSVPVAALSVNRILATTGPLTPRVNLPLFLFELKDIPSMLRHAGNLLLKIRRPSGLSPSKEAAAATLAYQFGWAPLIQDIGKLLDFSDAVRKQQKMIKEAHTTRGIRRRITLIDETSTASGNQAIWSAGGLSINTTYTDTRVAKRWATVRWKVRNNQQIGYEPTFGDAARTALGFNLGQIPITVWKAIPWSWMVDWFADISNVLQANYNMIYYRPTSLCIMTYLRTDRTQLPVYVGAIPRYEGAQLWRYTKARYVNASPSQSVSLTVPFMDTFKLSILGSLAILRIHGR